MVKKKKFFVRISVLNGSEVRGRKTRVGKREFPVPPNPLGTFKALMPKREVPSLGPLRRPCYGTERQDLSVLL